MGVRTDCYVPVAIGNSVGAALLLVIGSDFLVVVEVSAYSLIAASLTIEVTLMLTTRTDKGETK